MCDRCRDEPACTCACAFKDKVDWGRSFFWRWILTGEYCETCRHWEIKS